MKPIKCVDLWPLLASVGVIRCHELWHHTLMTSCRARNCSVNSKFAKDGVMSWLSNATISHIQYVWNASLLALLHMRPTKWSVCQCCCQYCCQYCMLAVPVPYKMVVSMHKLYTFQYSIRSYAHRGQGSVSNLVNNSTFLCACSIFDSSLSFGFFTRCIVCDPKATT